MGPMKFFQATINIWANTASVKEVCWQEQYKLYNRYGMRCQNPGNSVIGNKVRQLQKFAEGMQKK
jgi:hypothetical protein